jgi:hypothetical protein
MTIGRRIFWTILLLVTLALFNNVYSNFIIQEQGDLAVEQLNGGDVEYGVARVMVQDYSGYIVCLMVVLVLALWIPVIRGRTKQNMS